MQPSTYRDICTAIELAFSWAQLLITSPWHEIQMSHTSGVTLEAKPNPLLSVQDLRIQFWTVFIKSMGHLSWVPSFDCSPQFLWKTSLLSPVIINVGNC